MKLPTLDSYDSLIVSAQGPHCNGYLSSIVSRPCCKWAAGAWKNSNHKSLSGEEAGKKQTEVVERMRQGYHFALCCTEGCNCGNGEAISCRWSGQRTEVRREGCFMSQINRGAKAQGNPSPWPFIPKSTPNNPYNNNGLATISVVLNSILLSILIVTMVLLSTLC